MTIHLFLERTFAPPRSLEETHARIRDSGWCFAMHKVDWKESYLAVNGRTMICWFTALDKESVRVALRQTGADARVLWAGTVHEAHAPVTPNVVVERSFDDPVTLDAIQSIEDGAAWCLQTHHVRFARTIFSHDRKRMVCLYEAPDAESVRLSQREAAMPVDAVWACTRITPEMIL